MKTTVKFNKNLEDVKVTNSELIEATTNQNIINYLQERIQYDLFCKNQTKRGQARKNERYWARHHKFNKCSLTAKSDEELDKLKADLFNKKDAKIDKIEVEIIYDGRKKSNLYRIIQGVQMAIFTGGLSPQYYDIGLVTYSIIK